MSSGGGKGSVSNSHMSSHHSTSSASHGSSKERQRRAHSITATATPTVANAATGSASNSTTSVSQPTQPRTTVSRYTRPPPDLNELPSHDEWNPMSINFGVVGHSTIPVPVQQHNTQTEHANSNPISNQTPSNRHRHLVPSIHVGTANSGGNSPNSTTPQPPNSSRSSGHARTQSHTATHQQQQGSTSQHADRPPSPNSASFLPLLPSHNSAASQSSKGSGNSPVVISPRLHAAQYKHYQSGSLNSQQRGSEPNSPRDNSFDETLHHSLPLHTQHAFSHQAAAAPPHLPMVTNQQFHGVGRDRLVGENSFSSGSADFSGGSGYNSEDQSSQLEVQVNSHSIHRTHFPPPHGGGGGGGGHVQHTFGRTTSVPVAPKIIHSNRGGRSHAGSGYSSGYNSGRLSPTSLSYDEHLNPNYSPRVPHSIPTHAFQTPSPPAAQPTPQPPSFDPQVFLHMSELIASNLPFDILSSKLMDILTFSLSVANASIWKIMERELNTAQVGSNPSSTSQMQKYLLCCCAKQSVAVHNSSIQPPTMGTTLLLDGIVGYVGGKSDAVMLSQEPSRDWRYVASTDGVALCNGLNGEGACKNCVILPVRSPDGKALAVLIASNKLLHANVGGATSNTPEYTPFTQMDEVFLKSCAASFASIMRFEGMNAALNKSSTQLSISQNMSALLSSTGGWGTAMNLRQAVGHLEAVAARVSGAKKVRIYVVEQSTNSTNSSSSIGQSDGSSSITGGGTSVGSNGQQSLSIVWRNSSYVQPNQQSTTNATTSHRKTHSTRAKNLAHSVAHGLSSDDEKHATDGEYQREKRAKEQKEKAHAEDEDNVPFIRYKLGEGIVGSVCLSGLVANVPQADVEWRSRVTNATDPLTFSFASDSNDKRNNTPIVGGGTSCLVVPIKDFTGRVVAVLECIDKSTPTTVAAQQSAPPETPRQQPLQRNNSDEVVLPSTAFTSDDVFLLSALANASTSVLRNAQLYEETVSRTRKNEALLHIIDLMSTELGSSTIIPRIIDSAYKLVSCDRITLFLVQELSVASDKKDLLVKSGNASNMEQTNVSSTPTPVPDSRTETPLPPQSPRVQTAFGGTFLTSATPDQEPSSLSHSPVPYSSSNSSASVRSDANSDRLPPMRGSTALPPLTPASRSPSTDSVVTSPGANPSLSPPAVKELVCVVSKDESMRGCRVEWGVGIVGTVALTGRTLCIANPYSDSRFSQQADKKTNFVTRNILTVPVLDEHGACIAVIQAINRNSDYTSDNTALQVHASVEGFSPEDVNILESLAKSAGILLKKSKAIHATLLAERKSRALLDLFKVVARSDDPAVDFFETLDGIVEVLYSVLQPDRVTLYFVEGKELFSIVSKDVKGYRFPLGQGISGWVAQRGLIVNIRDAHRDLRFDQSFDAATGYRTKSVLCCPVKSASDSRVVAVIQLLNKRSPLNKESSLLRQATKSKSGSGLSNLTGSGSGSFSSSDFSGKGLSTFENMARFGTSSADVSPSKIPPTGFRSAKRGTKARATALSGVTSFSEDDAFLLQAICDQVSDTFRKHQSFAVSSHYGAENPKLRSLLNGYMQLPVHSIDFNNSPTVSVAPSPRSTMNFGTGPIHSLNGLELSPTNASQQLNKVNRPGFKGVPSLHASPNNTASGTFTPGLPSPERNSMAQGNISPFILSPAQRVEQSFGVYHRGARHRRGQSLTGVGGAVSLLSRRDGASTSMGLNATFSHGDRTVLSLGLKSANLAATFGSKDQVGKRSLAAQAAQARHRRGNSDMTILAAAAGSNELPPNSPSLTLSHTHFSVLANASGRDFTSLADEARAFHEKQLKEQEASPTKKADGTAQTEGGGSDLDTSVSILEQSVIDWELLLERLEAPFEWEASLAPNEASQRTFLASFQPNYQQTDATNNEEGEDDANFRKPSRSASLLSSARIGATHSTSPAAPNARLSLVVGQPSSKSFTLDLLEGVSFDPFSVSDDVLIEGLGCIFLYSGIIDSLSLSPHMLQDFLLQVRANYRNNPFHNFKHAFSVCHMSFLLMRQGNFLPAPRTVDGVDTSSQHGSPIHRHTSSDVTCGAPGLVEPIFTATHVFSLLLSSLCHDIDHPGNTNTQELLLSTERALVHNDVSILENHHSYSTFLILRQPRTNLLAHLPVEYQRVIRNQIITAILSTDMGVHFDKIKRMASLNSLADLDRTNEKERCLLLSLLIHSADLSGQTLPWRIANQWEDRITREFEAQTTLLRSRSLPTEAFMENLDDLENRFTLQVNFIEYVLSPWWKQIARLIPGTEACLKQLLENKATFQDKAREAKEIKDRNAAQSSLNKESSSSTESVLDAKGNLINMQLDHTSHVLTAITLTNADADSGNEDAETEEQGVDADQESESESEREEDDTDIAEAHIPN